MNLNKLSREQTSVLKGAIGATVVWGVGIIIGAFFLHRKHEEELDRLERDTARDCLDVAAEHYEKIFRRSKTKERFPSVALQAESGVPAEREDDSLRDGNAMNALTAASQGNVEVLSKRIDRLKRRHETLMNDIEARDVIFTAELERIRSKLEGN